jgi:hypothetical protein
MSFTRLQIILIERNVKAFLRRGATGSPSPGEQKKAEPYTVLPFGYVSW